MIPNSAGSFDLPGWSPIAPALAWMREFNACHTPGGPKGGQFCSTASHGLSYQAGSAPIPDYLKADVKAAKRAGISTFHMQYPEPVKDSTGKIQDPLAKSHAAHGETSFTDAKGMTHFVPRGRILIVTRGGEFEPEQQIWLDKYGFSTRREKKELTPADLKHPATSEDIVSTFRHEVGHFMRRTFRGTDSTPRGLASEIAAWQYALEISPTHTVSWRMVGSGLMSHAYYEFRAKALQSDPAFSRVASWDRAEVIDRNIKREMAAGHVSAPARAQAIQFTKRVLKSLKNYGAVLTKRGLHRVPDTWTPSAYAFQARKYVKRGPHGVGI